MRRARRVTSWDHREGGLQLDVLRSLLKRGVDTDYGRRCNFAEILKADDIRKEYSARVPLIKYEDIREDVMRVIHGEKDVFWPGSCRDFAQSSGTSGGKSKYIPITADSLRENHYAGGKDVVALYLNLVPESRIFSGKSFILGGSFSNTLEEKLDGVNVGDLSATLINRINPLANIMRIPDKRTALLPDWEIKLPALIKAAANQDVTNISGVPSWFLTVIRKIMELKGVDRISDVWPNLEVFFHGGISFAPYRDEYARITDPLKMHFMETYNASEGFFAVQNDFDDHSMLLLVDIGVYYEFIPIEKNNAAPVGIEEVEEGKIYELVISSCNGLWRYRPGDTVRISSVNPVKITIAGRTKSYINAFGEELMEDNAEVGMARACSECGCAVRNYTVAPRFAASGRKGGHQWVIEWEQAPEDSEKFAMSLDRHLRALNSDYDAKRSHDIFLERPEIIEAPDGLFDTWMRRAGNHKLGGQRKVPRLSNDRRLIEDLLSLRKEILQ